MLKKVFFVLFVTAFGLNAGEDSAFAAPMCQSLIKKPAISVPIDSKMRGANCRHRKVRYSQNSETQSTSVVIECSACYDGYTLENRTVVSTETGCEGGYATCVRNGPLVLACTSVTCPGKTDYFFDLLAQIDLDRSWQMGTKCYRGNSGSAVLGAVQKVSCAEGYEDYNVSFRFSQLGCGGSLNTCIPTYNFYCPEACPFKGWSPTQNHGMSKCVKSAGVLSYTCENSCEDGYQMTSRGCISCDSNMVCKVGQKPSCAVGYYRTGMETYGFACSKCPAVKTSDGSMVYGTTSGNAISITGCFLQEGSYEDDTGYFTISGECSYKS